MNNSTPESNWPAVSIAYDFVLPSYQWMNTRLEAVVNRIQGLMTFATTITLGFPVLGQVLNKSASFDSAALIFAITFFLVLTGIGIFARDVGETWLTSPAEIYNRNLHLSEWEFKRNALYRAGQAFTHNANLANRKAGLGRIMGGLLCGEVMCFLFWICGPHISISVLWSQLVR